MKKKSSMNLVAAPLLEGALICLAAVAGWLAHAPLIFASLGPTAYEMIELPGRKSARPYNVIVGHLVAIVAAALALWITRAWFAPAISTSGVPFSRVEAVTLAAILTVFGTLALRAAQPAALSTTLLISTGVLQSWRGMAYIGVGILIITAAGEPLRRWRAKHAEETFAN